MVRYANGSDQYGQIYVSTVNGALTVCGVSYVETWRPTQAGPISKRMETMVDVE